MEHKLLMRHVEYAYEQAKGCTGDELECFIEELMKLVSPPARAEFFATRKRREEQQ